jgi:acylphosphatase
MGKVRFYFKIFGDVQGIGFRYHLRGEAESFSLFGWARNANDGTVEGEIEGDEASVEKFFEKVEQGLGFAKVEKIEKESRTYGGKFGEFEIRS